MNRCEETVLQCLEESHYGENRRISSEIYELFYHRPICEYAETDGQKKTENVLILGSGWIGVEAFKAAFWAGQCLDSELNITVASQNASAFQRQVFSREPSAVLPALRLYTEEKHYANLFFQDIDVASGIDQAGLAPLDFENRKYNYIIVSLGDGEHNWIAALELLTRLYENTGRMVWNIRENGSSVFFRKRRRRWTRRTERPWSPWERSTELKCISSGKRVPPSALTLREPQRI